MFYVAWIMTEANCIFLQMNFICLCMYHILNVLHTYTRIKKKKKKLLRTAYLGEIDGNSCELICLFSSKVYAAQFSCLHSSSFPILNDWHMIQDNYSLFTEVINRMEETSIADKGWVACGNFE